MKYIIENKDEIFEAIYSEDLTWKGTANGDTAIKHQGRKLKQLALVLMLAGEEMSREECFLSEAQRKKLFYDFIRFLPAGLAEAASLYKLM